MTGQEVATLAFRITGIYVIVEAMQPFITGISSGAFLITDSKVEGLNESPLLPVLLMIVLPLLVIGGGIACFVHSRRLAAWTFPDGGGAAPTANNLTALEIQGIAFSVLGLWLLCRGAAGLAQGLAGIWVTAHAQEAFGLRVPSREWLRQLASPIVMLALGAYLFFRFEDVIAYWRRWRRTGSDT